MKQNTLQAAFLAVIFLTVFAFSGAIADKNPEMKTVDGSLICSSCLLKAECGAKAMCSEYGCDAALKTADGKIWHILKNDRSDNLVRKHDHMGENIKLTGYFHNNSQTIDLTSYEIDGKKMSWCEGHSKMDACMAKSHKY